MTYTKNTWTTGDTVTAAKLNNMEDGIAAGGVMIVEVEGINGMLTADHTFAEIFEAMNGGTPVFLHIASEDDLEAWATASQFYPVVLAYKYDDVFRIAASAARRTVLEGVVGFGPAIYLMTASTPSSAPVYYATFYPQTTNFNTGYE